MSKHPGHLRVIALAFSLSLGMRAARANETAVKRDKLPKALRTAVSEFIKSHYQRACTTEDSFEWAHATSSLGDETDYVTQLAKMSWLVTKERLGEGDRRNGIEFRGTLTITAEASRYYVANRREWSEWHNGGAGTHFLIIKEAGKNWVIRPDLPAFEYGLISCQELGRRGIHVK